MLQVNLTDFLDYTEWQRDRWQAVLREQGAGALTASAGPHGDGRFEAVGDLIRHIFSAERRYVERLEGRPLTDTSTLASDDLDALFTFGRESRRELRRLLETFPPEQLEVPREFLLMNARVVATPRKILVHVVLHEIRHWAQIATLLRLRGASGGLQDFLFSPVLGGALAR
jgi:uncharacterized damage-inducible protein DinB